MFVYNVKVNSRKLFKLIFGLMIILGIIICGITIYKVVFKNGAETTEGVYQIPPNNYTNILNAVHNDIDNYIGQKISFSGYVYRVYDLTENQFVLARDMVVSSDFQTVVVGFLCSFDKASSYKDNTWVNITGKITKGYYHGDIPIIEIETIEEIKKPADSYVYPPDDFYIPTSSLLYNNF